MKDASSVSVSEFWIRVMEKLNSSGDIYRPVPQVLTDTCEFFEFGCGFIYEANHTNTFFLRESYLLYEYDHLRESIDMELCLGTEMLSELGQQNVIMFTAEKDKSQLEEQLGNLFNANSMILIPIADQDRALIAFVGLVDRRGASRREVPEIDAAYAVLCAIANHVKLQLYQSRVKTTERALRSIMDHMGIDIYVNDFFTHEILYANRSMAAPYGGIDVLEGKKCWDALYDGKTGPCDFCPQKKLIDENGNPTKIYSWDYQRPWDGSWFRVFSAAFRWTDGRLAHVVSSVDVTDSKRNEIIIRQLADFDALTGLPNRRKLMNDLERCVQEMDLESQGGYIIFFDLDGFKQVNDTLGHQAGDELLEKIGNMLQDNPLTEGVSYRHGGDEFVVLCNRQNLLRFNDVFNSLRANFQLPWQLEDGEATCNASMGIVHYPRDGRNAEELLHRADMAMYSAKKLGRGHAMFYNQGNLCSPEQYLEDHGDF